MNLRKRRTAPAESEGKEHDFLDELLEEHETNGVLERAAKRNRGEGICHRGLDDDGGDQQQQPPAEPIPLDSIPSPAVESIFDCLNAPRDVHNLAHTCKYMLSHLNTRIVIRAAVFADVPKRGDARTPKVVAALIKSVDNNSIHVPSAMRLLRLLNATRCERGVQCYAYDLKREVAAPLDHRTVAHRPYGLSLCSKCVKVGAYRMRWNHIGREEARVATFDYTRVAQEQLAPLNAAAGEICGPIIHARHLLQIDATYSSRDEKKAALEKLIADLYGEDGKPKRAAYELRASKLVGVYLSAQIDQLTRLLVEKRRETAEWRAKQNERIAKRVKNLRLMFGHLKQHLEGAPMADATLDVIWRENDHDNCLSFRCTIVSEITNSLVAAPAGATRKKIANAAALIRTDLDTLASSEDDFLNFSFLAGGSEGPPLPIKRALLRYCREHLSPPSRLLREPKADRRFVELVRTKQYMAALVRLLQSDGDLLLGIVSQAYVPDFISNVDKYRSLVKVVWGKLEGDMYSRGAMRGAEWWTATQISALCKSCQTQYFAMRSAARCYLSHPATVEWLDLGADHGIGAGIGVITRQDAADQAFKPKTANVYRGGWSNPMPPMSIRNEQPYNLLRDRNFDRLLEVHQFYYRVGRVY